jgi:hypothetical protein
MQQVQEHSGKEADEQAVDFVFTATRGIAEVERESQCMRSSREPRSMIYARNDPNVCVPARPGVFLPFYINKNSP